MKTLRIATTILIVGSGLALIFPGTRTWLLSWRRASKMGMSENYRLPAVLKKEAVEESRLAQFETYIGTELPQKLGTPKTRKTIDEMRDGDTPYACLVTEYEGAILSSCQNKTFPHNTPIYGYEIEGREIPLPFGLKVGETTLSQTKDIFSDLFVTAEKRRDAKGYLDMLGAGGSNKSLQEKMWVVLDYQDVLFFYFDREEKLLRIASGRDG